MSEMQSLKLFKCQDEDCGKLLKEHELVSFINSVGKKVIKCAYCRGKVKEFNPISKSEFRRLEIQLKKEE